MQCGDRLCPAVLILEEIADGKVRTDMQGERCLEEGREILEVKLLRWMALAGSFGGQGPAAGGPLVVVR